MKYFICLFIVFPFYAWSQNGDQENLTTQTINGGPFARKLFGRYVSNEHSTMQSSIIVINNADLPLEIRSAEAHYSLDDGQYIVTINVVGQQTAVTTGSKLRVMLFDPFGKWIDSLGGTYYRDHPAGVWYGKYTWASRIKNYAEALKVVVVMDKMRLANGEIIETDWEDIVEKLNELGFDDFQFNPAN